MQLIVILIFDKKGVFVYFLIIIVVINWFEGALLAPFLIVLFNINL